MARRLLPLLLFGGIFALLTAPSGTAHAYRVPVNIESVPPGATVYLDSTSNPPLGTTPLRNVRIERGSHTIIFQLANHEEARLQVNVRRRRETFRAVLRALGTIEVSAGNEGARGGRVLVDGRPIQGTLGGTPIRVTDLQPGRHQVRVEREGYDTFEQWVEVGGGQLVRVAAVLQRTAPETGSILVAGPTGAPVFVDGQQQGTAPTVLDDVSVGSHTVEIRPPGQPPYSQSVTVLAGQRVTVAMPQQGGATLRVLASAEGAVISIDGEVIGPSPASRSDLAPGEHIVEARAEGYERARQTVTLEAGQSRVISLDMERQQGEAGRIVVESNVDGATVLIDGEERGQAPVVFTPEPGPHAIVVRADGHQEYSTTCETAPGQSCEVEAVLVPEQVRVAVRVQPGIRDAELLVDGEVAGPVPFDGTLPAGSHVITVRAPGYEEYRQQVLLQPSSEVRPFDVTLPEITDGLSEGERQRMREEQERRYAAAVTHSAAPLPVNHATLDLSIGWPYLAEVRLNVGLLDWLDAGFAVRSFGRLTEFEGRVRAGYRPLEQLAVGGQVRFGGGIGPELAFRTPDYPDDAIMGAMGPRPPLQHERIDVRPETPPEETSMAFGYPVNSAFLSLEALASLHFSDQGAFTLWLAVDFSSDEYAGHPLNSGTYLDFAPNPTDENPTGFVEYCSVDASNTLSCPREDFARARLGGSLELVLTRNWNLWFLLEGILSSQPRRIMGNLLGIETNDTQFYFRIGTTHKF
jgi:hypothetical protein